jgi:hypothetical protein
VIETQTLHFDSESAQHAFDSVAPYPPRRHPEIARRKRLRQKSSNHPRRPPLA